MDIKRTISKVRNAVAALISTAIVTNTDSDADLDQVVQVTEAGKAVPVLMLSPYGVSSNIPLGATVIKIQNDGSAEALMGYASFPENRFRDLKVWEVAFGNYKTKAHIKMNDSGEIGLFLDNEKPSGDYMARFNELESGHNELRDDLNNALDILHTHFHDVAALPSVGSPPPTIPTLTPSYTPPVLKPTHSTASIAAAKITKIRVPTDD